MLFNVAGATSSPKQSGSNRFYKFVYDVRFPCAVRCAASMGANRLERAAISGDVTALWRDDLRGHWSQPSGPVAGMTAGGAALCLQQMGRDQWIRAVLHVRHLPAVDGSMRHLMTGAEPLVAQLSEHLQTGTGDWAARVGGYLLDVELPTAATAAARCTITTPGAGHELSEPVDSWIMAAALTTQNRGAV
jgi:hypothetical protein